MLDNFLIIVGAQKCGTTTLHGHLSTSNYFACSKVKELHYFDTVKSGDINKYTALFSVGEQSQCYLESTPSYLYLPDVPALVSETLKGKNVKIIVCLRDPVQRAYSHYQMNVRRQQETESFDSAFKRKSVHVDDSYYPRGLYADQISRYIERFGKDSVLVLEMENDFADTPALNDKLNRFMGLSLGLSNELNILNGSWSFKNKWLAKLFSPRWIRRIGRAPMLRKAREVFVKWVSVSDKTAITKEQSPDLSEYKEYYKNEKAAVEKLIGRNLSWRGFS